MKKKYPILIALLLLFAGFLFFMPMTGSGLAPRLVKETVSRVPFLRSLFFSENQGYAAKETASQRTPGMPGMEMPAAPEKRSEVPQQQGEQQAPTIEIPLEKQQLIGVKTVVVSEHPLHRTIRTVGRIEYDERKLATINTKFEGWIERLYADYTGKYVKKGDPLVDIYSPELFATQQEFITALKWIKHSGEIKDSTIAKMLSKDAEAMREAVHQRLRLWDITEEQIRTVEETGKPIRTLTIFSPVSGYVVQKMAVQGMRVMPGEKLLDIADLSTLWVISDIYEYELPLIKVGQKASITMSYFPGKEFESKIDYIYPTLSGETRTVKARLIIPNQDGQLKPQMFTNVEIEIDLGKRLSVPEDAVIDTGIRHIVYVDKGEGYFEPREVIPGLKADGMLEIIKGLKAGEKVASAANFLIDSEAKLRSVEPLAGHKGH